MNKKIIIDLDGVVFEPVGLHFAAAAKEGYGTMKGGAITFAYRHGLGRMLFQNEVETVLSQCAGNPKMRPGVSDALDKMARLPGAKIEFCGQLAFPGQEYALEQKYRAMAPCLDGGASYTLVSPFASKRDYLRATTADENYWNYIVGTRSDDLRWPAYWRISPVLIGGTAVDWEKLMRNYRAHVFASLADFQGYLARRR